MKTYLKDLTIEEIIKRLKNGEVIKIEYNKGYYKMIDGIICRFYEDGDVGVGDMFYKKPKDAYFETEEPFEIKETGFYKTRDGSKVYISWIKYYNDNGMCSSSDEFVCYGIFENGDNVFTWNIFGKSNSNSDKLDIISKWED